MTGYALWERVIHAVCFTLGGTILALLLLAGALALAIFVSCIASGFVKTVRCEKEFEIYRQARCKNRLSPHEAAGVLWERMINDALLCGKITAEQAEIMRPARETGGEDAAKD